MPTPRLMADGVRKIVDTGHRGGVFFLHGEDEYRKGGAADEVVTEHIDPATRDFNFDSLSGSDVDVETLASLIATPPMMAEWRVVLVKGAEAFAGSPKMRELVLETAKNPPPGMVLVLVAKMPQGSKAQFYKQLSKEARSFEFKAISQDDVPGWLMEQARTVHGKPLASDAAQALAGALGNDLGILSQELTKLAAVAGDDPEVSLKTVKEAGTQLPSQDRWAWFELVGGKRFSAALSALPILLAQGESGVALTMGLTSQLLRIGVVVEEGPGALEKVLPRHQQWLARGYGGQANQWAGEELSGAILGLRRLDRLLKASPLPDEHHLSEWLLGQIAGAGAVAG
jgi:DNA polymerase III subunit delta